MNVVLPPLDAGGEAERICAFISRFVEERGVSGVVLGLSGGIDSAVVAALCARSLDPRRVRALLLPERDSSPESVTDARELAERLAIPYEIRDLTPVLRELGCYERSASGVGRFAGARAGVRLVPGLARRGFLTNLAGGGGKHFQEFLAFHRIKHRLRMVSVYRVAEERHLAVASCANRTEHEIGFFVRYGDDSGDIAPIVHLYKTQVLALGRHLSLPAAILEKRPSPDLFAGMADEELMGISYETLDSILFGIDRGLGRDDIAERGAIDSKTVDYVLRITAASEPMRRPPATLSPDASPSG